MQHYRNGTTSTFHGQVSERINWLREQTLDTVVHETIKALRDGEDEDVLWAAGALTACYYVKNEAHNLLGFVSHAMIGCEDARSLALGQARDTRWLLLVQALYQVVFDLHDPCLSPYEMLPARPYTTGNSADDIHWLREDVRMGEYLRADARAVHLEKVLPRAEFIDLMLDIGLEGIVTDDHTLISPQLCLGMIDDVVGWEHGWEMLRATLRYNASFHRNFEPYDRAVVLAKQYGLWDGAANDALNLDQIEPLRQQFHAAAPHNRPEVAARAMAQEGVSPATVLAAVTLTAADLYLMAEPVPHEDFDAVSREVAPIHIGTSTNAMRKILPQMSPRTQVLAAIQGGSLLERGPSVLDATFHFIPFEVRPPYPYAEDVARLRSMTPDALLNRLREALFAHDYNVSTAAVRAYADQSADPEALIALLTEVACTDDGTLLHNFKHLYAMVMEFRASTHPDRWQYLIAAARWIAWYAGKNTRAHGLALEAMGVGEPLLQPEVA
jgi:hypothetical protein